MICFISGASRGFGRSFAVELATAFNGPVKLVLCSRDNDKLVELRDELLILRNYQDIEVEIVASDLSDLNNLSDISNRLFNNHGNLYQRHIFLNNAGSLGVLNSVKNILDIREFQSIIDFNVTSSLFLTSQFVRYFSSFNDPSHRGLVINVSSLCAVKPFPSWSLYCAGKAARDLFSQVLAQELSDSSLQVLNYAPGPLDTDMQREIRDSPNCDPALHEIYEKMHENGTLIKPEQSARILISLAQKMIMSDTTAPKSGDHIDYFDCI